jgi:protein-disulfide isomerase
MVFCIVAIVIFGILGIFSAKYRAYFRESLHCIKRQITLRPCDTNFDEKMKSKMSGKLMRISPKIAGFVYRKFVFITWLFIAVMIVSLIGIGIGVYNFAIYNNCNGPGSHDFCILNAFGGSLNDQIAKLKPVGPDDDPTVGNPNASVRIVEVGCFMCPYTRNSESIRTQLLEKYNNNVSFTFRSIPLPQHNMSWITAEAADCALEQGKYWEYHDKLFENQMNMSMEKLYSIANEIGLNTEQFAKCLETGKYSNEVKKDADDATAAGIFATPTYFVNGRPFVGIKSFAEFEKIVIGEIQGSCTAS